MFLSFLLFPCGNVDKLTSPSPKSMSKPSLKFNPIFSQVNSERKEINVQLNLFEEKMTNLKYQYFYFFISSQKSWFQNLEPNLILNLQFTGLSLSTASLVFVYLWLLYFKIKYRQRYIEHLQTANLIHVRMPASNLNCFIIKETCWNIRWNFNI